MAISPIFPMTPNMGSVPWVRSVRPARTSRSAVRRCVNDIYTQSVDSDEGESKENEIMGVGGIGWLADEGVELLGSTEGDRARGIYRKLSKEHTD